MGVRNWDSTLFCIWVAVVADTYVRDWAVQVLSSIFQRSGDRLLLVSIRMNCDGLALADS